MRGLDEKESVWKAVVSGCFLVLGVNDCLLRVLLLWVYFFLSCVRVDFLISFDTL